MNRTPASILLLATLLFLGCSGGSRDKVINVQEDDAEMGAAIAKARETLPQFWQVFEKRDRGESDFALKVHIADKNGSEHFWANEIERKDGKVFGIINNDPNTVKSVKLGDRVEIPEAEISDWLYMRDGKMVGNYTLKALFPKMPASEVAKLKQIMAD